MEKSIVKQTTIFTRYMDSFMEKLPAFLVAIITVVIGIILAKIVKKMLTKFFRKYKSSAGIITFLINFAQVAIIIAACLQALNGMGVNTTSFAAVLGAAGFSIGLAFKEVLANLGSCMIVLFFKPFDIGDYIMCESIEGTVYEIQMFSTTLKTNDNKLIIVPNTQLTTNPVTNFTSQEKRRIDYIFNVEYDTDVKKLYEIANKIFEAETSVLDSPQPLIGVESMDNNIIKFVAKPWVKTEDYWDVYYKIMEEFKHEFDLNGIELSRVHIVSANK